MMRDIAIFLLILALIFVMTLVALSWTISHMQFRLPAA